MNVHSLLKSRRIELDLTLEQVAQYVGVGKSTVRKWENGIIKNMGRDKIQALSEILKISPVLIMGKEDNDLFIQYRRGQFQPFRLKQYRISTHEAPELVASRLGVPKHVYLGWEDGSMTAFVEQIEDIAKYFDISTDYLYGYTDDPKAGIKKHNVLTAASQRIGWAYEKAPLPVQRTVEVALEPYMDDVSNNVILLDFDISEQPASAGTGIFLNEEYTYTVKVRAGVIPETPCFGVPVAGDSMEPRYHDGDILIVSKEPVNVGEIGVFTMDGEGFVKKLGRGVLHSLNHSYEDIPLTEDVICNGKVVGILSPDDIEE